MSAPAPAPVTASAVRRSRRNLNSRRVMCQAAVDLFSRHGYAATTAGAIANAAEYAERTFFRHFARKEDVIFYDLPELMDSLRADIDDARGESAWTVIRSAFTANAGRWDSTDQLTLGRVRLFHSEPALKVRYLEICGDWEDLAAQILAAELRVDPESDMRCRLVATAAVGCVRAAFRAWLADPTGRIAEHVARGFDHVEAGLSAGPPATPGDPTQTSSRRS